MEQCFMNISSTVISQSLNVAAFHEAAEQLGAKACKWRKELICVPGPKSLSLPLVQQTLLPLSFPPQGFLSSLCQPSKLQPSYTPTECSPTDKSCRQLILVRRDRARFCQKTTPSCNTQGTAEAS